MHETRGRQPMLLATRSDGKSRELRALCASFGYAVETLDELGIAEASDEDHIERYDSFDENATAKARYFAALLPGRVILAEDSGLEVDALGGAPGVRSKRWSGSRASGAALDAENNAALVAALESQRSARARVARYRCVAVCVDAERVWRGDGRVEGAITLVARGEGGFGYDPYFECAELGKTFAEASPEEKSRVSHRARAVHAVFASASTELVKRVKGVS